MPPLPEPLRYRELSPPAVLADWVDCVWQSRGSVPGPTRVRILPDGCCDLLFDAQQAHWRCVGTMTRALTLAYGVGARVDVFGVRLKPGGLRRLLPLPALELTDRAVALDDWLSRTLARGLGAAALQRVAPTLAARAAWLWPRLLALADAGAADAAVTVALHRLGGADPIRPTAMADGMPIARLARDLGLSARTLQRRFEESVGLSPIGFRRLLRFRRVLKGLPATGAPPDWAALACDSGYADQAHLVREFSGFAGISPGRWWREQKPRP